MWNVDTDYKFVSADSPRVYMSTNPWKITATFQALASTRDEFMTVLQKVKDAAPSEPKFGEKRSKLELAHLALIKALEHRVELIDHELAVSIILCFCCNRCYVPSHGGKGSRNRSLDDGIRSTRD